MAKSDLPIIEQRRIEANIIKPIYDTMKAELGAERAKQILSKAIIDNAVAQGKAYAATETATDLASFHELFPQWTANGALEVEFIEESPEAVSYNVTRCRYSEMYKEMGLTEIGPILSCARDGTFCKGYNPNIHLTRTQTLMEGASHCDFRYVWRPNDETDN